MKKMGGLKRQGRYGVMAGKTCPYRDIANGLQDAASRQIQDISVYCVMFVTIHSSTKSTFGA